MTRYREKPGQVASGTYEYVDTSGYGTNLRGTKTVHGEPTKCWDTVHTQPYGDKRSDLTITSMKIKPARFNMPLAHYVRDDRRITNVPLLPSSSAPSVSESWQGLINQALHTIQDSGPIADVVTDIAEITDIPRKAYGIVDNIAKHWLQYQWAIRPLMTNLLKTRSLVNEISQRLDRHRRKIRTKRWRGRGKGIAFMWSEGSSSSNQQVNASETVICLQDADIVKNDAWWVASLEVKDNFDVPEFMTRQWDNGFQTGFKDRGAYIRAMYELIPWTWLIDYFTTLGSLITYKTNTVVYDVPAISLMATYEVRRRIYPAMWSSGGTKHWGDVTSGYTLKTYKRRLIQYSPPIGLAIEPLLTKTQIANLLAVAAGFRHLKGRM